MNDSELKVVVTREGDVARLRMTGEIDSLAADALEAGYTEAADGSTAVVLDFADTAYINSSGIALIVGLLGQARSRGIEIRAAGLSDHYREIFEITRLSDFMTILDTEQSANGAEGTNDA